MVGMKSLYLPFADAFIRYHDIGAGKDAPVLVYLSGLNFSVLSCHLKLATHPSLSSYRAILVEYLGTGHSETPAAFSYTPQAHAECVAAVLKHEGIEGCTLVGHSQGGTVGIELAHANPDLVVHLIVCEGNLTPGGGAGTKYFASVEEDRFATDLFPRFLHGRRKAAIEGDGAAAAMLAGWVGSDVRAIHKASVALVDLDPETETRFLNLQTRRSFIYGELSIPEAGAAYLPDVPDPAWLEAHGVVTAIMPGADHSMMMKDPDGFAKVLKPLL